MRIAVIPARGGSKRIPRKNIKLFCGKPIIGWSVEAALQSGCFDHVVVSTDDEEIAEVARKYGAQVPFKRAPELSDDHSVSTDVVVDAINWYARQGQILDYVCCIYATAPFITAAILCEGLQSLIDTGCDYAFSVSNYPFPIQRAIRITDSKRVEMFNPEYFATRSQDLEMAYHDAGQFYWGKSSAWLSRNIILSSSSIPVLLPRYCVQDIDTPEDWVYAEWLFKTFNYIKGSP